MSDEQSHYILQLAHQIEWPSNREILPGSQAVYEQGLDLLNTYRGYPQVLVEALQVFRSTNALPYALSGLAATLSLSSYIPNNNYEPAGLQEVLRWLKLAQSMAPDRLEIDCQEALIYIQGRQFDKARQALDTLGQDPQSAKYFFFCTAELSYWSRLGNLLKVQSWRDKAQAAARNTMQEYYVRHIFAAFFLDNKLYLDYIKAGQELTRLSPGDPWLWHNLSEAHYQLRQIPEAGFCNQRALSLLDFGAARQMRELLRRH